MSALARLSRICCFLGGLLCSHVIARGIVALRRQPRGLAGALTLSPSPLRRPPPRRYLGVLRHPLMRIKWTLPSGERRRRPWTAKRDIRLT
jgi:hypothetical protein